MSVVVKTPPIGVNDPLINKFEELLLHGHQLFHTGKTMEAERIWHWIARTRREHARKIGYDAVGSRFLTGRWVQNIGHFIYLDSYIKLWKMGYLGDIRTLYLILNIYGRVRISNTCLLDLYARHLHVISNEQADIPDALRVVAHWLRDDYESIQLESGEGLTADEMVRFAHTQWRQRGLAPLVSLNDQQLEIGESYLRQHIGSDRKWFVGIHVRTPGYNGVGTTIRDCDIDDYLGAIKRILDMGGAVIRLGHDKMKPLPKLDGLIDYACDKNKRPEIDIYAVARSKFHIGCASGMDPIPNLFGVPIIILNHAPIGMDVWSFMASYLPKTYSTMDGRPLSLSELAERSLQEIESAEILAHHGVKVKSISPEAIESIVVRYATDCDAAIAADKSGNAVSRAFFNHCQGLGLHSAAMPAIEFARDEFASFHERLEVCQ